MLYLGPDPIQSPHRTMARSRPARAVASAVRARDDASVRTPAGAVARRDAIVLTDLILDIARDARMDGRSGRRRAMPQAETHWSRILCYDLAARDACWADETSMLLTQPEPRHGVVEPGGKRLAIRTLVLAASCVALYLVGSAFFRASTLPNAAASVAPQTMILQSPPSRPNFPIDVRPPAGHDALASTSNDRDSARECAPSTGVASECIFN